VEDAIEVVCPYCGEPGTITVIAGEEDDEFVQDCPVCCRPWKVRVKVRRDGSADVSVEGEGD
jgi:hypothetical protein